MGFLTLYNKYRPRDFNDLVGQDYIVHTLRNALRHDRVGHAYLFAGPRGTGKTSTAKVLARALNCRDDSSLEPCGECEPCHQIAEEKSMDVVEIDAASNRGVDEIRELREKIRFSPGKGDYKIYIIDEVHMLTTEAFNALLKTLEEPPESVVFILATTEPRRVLDTIQSRCQRFDFSLLSVSDIQSRLVHICEAEEVEYEKRALNIIAHSSKGGMRDAISILDQAISYTDGNITVDQLTGMLGKVARERLKEFLLCLHNAKLGKSLELINQLVKDGKGISSFVEDLIDHCRQLLVVKECGVNSGILDFTEETMQQRNKEAQNYSTSFLLDMIGNLTEVRNDLKYTNQPRQELEMGIIKFISSRRTEKKTRDKQQEQSEVEVDKTEKTKQSAEKPEQKSDDEKFETRSDEKSAEQKAEPVDKSQKKRLTLSVIKDNWSQVLKNLQKENVKTRAFLVEGEPVKVKDETLYIEFSAKNKFHKKGAQENKQLIRRIIQNTINLSCEVEFFLSGENFVQENVSQSDEKENTDQKKKDTSDKKNESDEKKKRLEKIAEMFDGEIIKIDREHLST